MPLPPIVAALSPEDRSVFRHRLGEAVEWLVALLDAIDGDPDLEPYLAGNPYANEGYGYRDTNDREGDCSDYEPEEEDDDGDTGIADMDAFGDPELCWTAKGLAFDGSGAASALALLESRRAVR